MKNELILQKKINKIGKIIDLSKLSNKTIYSIDDIKECYRINKLAYRFFHSNKGFMHFRVTIGNKLRKTDILYQPNVISKYINKNATVVELGSGQSSNLAYLSKKHPDASFIGVDLYPSGVKSIKNKNVKIYKQDYSDLSFIDSNSVDVVFAIETIVHNSDKKRVFSEVARILKKDGIFIVYDYSLVNELESYLPYQQTAIKIVSSSGACPTIESFRKWNSYFKNAGFVEIKTTNLTNETLPDLKRLKQLSGIAMKFNVVAKLLFKILPKDFINNALIGYIGYDANKEGIGYYTEWIYKK